MPVSPHRPPTIATAALLLAACGPAAPDLDDTYPRNCGVEGPVELFATDSTVSSLDVNRAGEHYLVSVSDDWPTAMNPSLEHWAVDRCGETRTLLHRGTFGDSRLFGAAGDHLLTCDTTTGAMSWIDPAGVEPPRLLFPAVEKCRVVPIGKGLAAQQRGGGTVWFHPDPADAEQQARVVTDAARVADPDWIWCSDGGDFACNSAHPFGIDIRVAGDELLVALQSEELLAFSSTSLSSRIVDPGPLFAMDVLSGGDRIVVSRHFGPTLIVERTTGASFELCCYDDLEPIQQLGDWLIQGRFRVPLAPEPEQWTNFVAHHLPTGMRTTIEGRDGWHPVAPLSADTVLVDVHPDMRYPEEERTVVSLATGEQQVVDFPGTEAWSLPGRDGVFAVETTANGETLRLLPGPGQASRTLLQDVRIAFATDDGRIVFEQAREPGEPTPLSVMLPDERVVVLDEGHLGAIGEYFYSEPWPLDRDELLYGVADDGRSVLRRTVLP